MVTPHLGTPDTRTNYTIDRRNIRTASGIHPTGKLEFCAATKYKHTLILNQNVTTGEPRGQMFSRSCRMINNIYQQLLHTICLHFVIPHFLWNSMYKILNIKLIVQCKFSNTQTMEIMQSCTMPKSFARKGLPGLPTSFFFSILLKIFSYFE